MNKNSKNKWQETQGRYTLDIGWYSDGDLIGVFKYYIVVDNNWENPYKEFETKSISEVIKWFDDTRAEIETWKISEFFNKY